MEQGDDLLQLLLPRFNGEDFEDWKIQMKVMLKSKDLWEVVTKEISSQNEQIRKKDSGALFYIFRAVDKNIFRSIADSSSAYSAWKLLELKYGEAAQESEQSNGLQPMTAHTWYQDFYNAIVKGKHEKVETCLERNNRVVVVSRITAGQDIPLHIAARVGHLKIVKLLLDRMNKEEVMLMNNNYRTALHLAASGGHLNVVMALVEKERRLVLRECDEQIPLHHAIRNQHKKVVEYLFKATIEVDKADAKNDKEDWDKKARNKFRVTILIALIYGNFYDLALKLVNDFPELLLIKDRFNKTAILALIESTSEHETWWAALLTPISISISTSIEYIKSRIFSFRGDRQDEENAVRECLAPIVPSTDIGGKLRQVDIWH
uniref:Uncharacterized protein n=1 Tax=Nelumbo nucifera TaxID=4432 RepID=A0A822YNX6_NELNU|nr:TPA_asm: hypothetical protein HUJ06_011407 [Nelumbo nucifera]